MIHIGDPSPHYHQAMCTKPLTSPNFPVQQFGIITLAFEHIRRLGIKTFTCAHLESIIPCRLSILQPVPFPMLALVHGSALPAVAASHIKLSGLHPIIPHPLPHPHTVTQATELLYQQLPPSKICSGNSRSLSQSN